MGGSLWSRGVDHALLPPESPKVRPTDSAGVFVPFAPLRDTLDRALADRYGVPAFNLIDDPSGARPSAWPRRP